MFTEIEAAVVGMQPGEEKTVDVDFPADWRVAAVRRQDRDVTVKVIDVSEPVLPEVDAAFIRSFGVKSGEPEQFRAEIRSNLERELKGALMKRLRKRSRRAAGRAPTRDVEMPPRLVENEAARCWPTPGRAGPPPGPAGRRRRRAVHGRRRASACWSRLLVGEIARRNELRLEPARV